MIYYNDQMGVPSFFAWLAKHYSDILLKTSRSEICQAGRKTKLYLDFNGAIHPAIRTDPNLSRADMNEAVIRSLTSILEYIKPDAVYIAIDGVAPAAKMDQQRDRRYKSAKESQSIREINIRHGEKVRDDPVDFNMISPGTEFMDNLQEFLVSQITELTGPGGIWRQYQFTLEGANIPGEGEHKIMTDIRANREKGIMENCLIYGLDADLLFLSIINCPDAVLVRENVYFKNREQTEFYDSEKYPYIYLDVSVLREKIVETLSPYTDVKTLGQMGFKHDIIRPRDVPALCANTWWYDPAHSQRLILDYAYICFFLGNDFVPHLPCLRIRNGSLNDIIVIYKKVAWTLGGFLVKEDGSSLHPQFLKEFLAEVAYVEDQLLEQQTHDRLRSIDSFNRRLNGMAPLKRDLEKYGYIEDTYADTIRGGTPGWQTRYYNYYHNMNYRSGNPKDYKRRVLPICQSYIDMTRWVLGYYQGNHTNWSWHYPYDAAPTTADLYDFYEDLDLDTAIPADAPVSPYEQLMSILPPESAGLLPPPLADYMVNPHSELHHMYPIAVKFVLEGNKFRHECKARLPLVDRHSISEIVAAVGETLTPDQKRRGLTQEATPTPIIFGART